jgi:beta-glucosidase/6-phospho-beta-glucosidase/beta-galactosidase
MRFAYVLKMKTSMIAMLTNNFEQQWNDGDYPQVLKDTLGDILPTLTQDEKDLIKGSCDFFAIDPYTSYYAYGIEDFDACVSNSSAPGFPECAGSTQTAPNGFPAGPAADPGASWLYDTPTGVRKFLNTITKDLFPSVPDIQVTEFGFAEPFESELTSLQTILWDLRRADYYQSYLDNILAAIVYDGVNVTGAWGWAIFDSESCAIRTCVFCMRYMCSAADLSCEDFEWGSGQTTRFGLQYVNYTDLTRTPKASMFTFVNWFNHHGGGSSAEPGNSTYKMMR